MAETGVLRGLGATPAIEATVKGGRIWTVCCARRRRLDVSRVIGRNAVEAVRVTGLGRE